MFVGDSLHKLDTGEVLPVAHGLLEQCLVGAAEVAVDLVGDNAVVPDTFLAGGGSAGDTPHRGRRQPGGGRGAWHTVEAANTLMSGVKAIHVDCAVGFMEVARSVGYVAWHCCEGTALTSPARARSAFLTRYK